MLRIESSTKAEASSTQTAIAGISDLLHKAIDQNPDVAAIRKRRVLKVEPQPAQIEEPHTRRSAQPTVGEASHDASRLRARWSGISTSHDRYEGIPVDALDTSKALSTGHIELSRRRETLSAASRPPAPQTWSKAPDGLGPAIKGLPGECKAYCPCYCHQRIDVMSSPTWMSSVLGKLTINQTNMSLGGRLSCDSPVCGNRSDISANLLYQFPPWLFNRSVDLRWESKTSGPQMSIRTSRVLPSDDDIWLAVQEGNIQFLRDGFSTRKYLPNDIDENGDTLLYVSYKSRLEMASLTKYSI